MPNLGGKLTKRAQGARAIGEWECFLSGSDDDVGDVDIWLLSMQFVLHMS